MSDAISTRLYSLLPELYRWRDEQQGKPLQALFTILEREYRALEVDTEAMYDNWFIQTCDNWVVPYLAELLGIRDPIVQIDYLPFTQRRRVANTLAYRRRKGTVAVLEQVLWDVTNWHVRAVEFYRLLATTQHLQHLQGDQVVSVSLKDMAALAALESSFSLLPRSSDIRAATPGTPKIATAANLPTTPNAAAQTTGGKYNRHNLGLFFWRLRPYPVNRGFPKQHEAETQFFTFSPTGHDTQLFNRPQSYQALVQRANAINMPVLISRANLAADLSNYRRQFKERSLAQPPLNSTYYGPDRSFNITDIRERPLFDVPREPSVLVELNKGVLANKLRQALASEGVLLSQNISVRPITKDKYWQIEDASLGKSYRLNTVENALRVVCTQEQILPANILSADLSEWRSLAPLRDYYVSDAPLFSTDLGFASELDKSQLSAKLRAQFQANGVPLTDKARLTIEEPEYKWVIVDAGRKYAIKRKDQTLDVHDDAPPALVAVDPELGRIALLNEPIERGKLPIRVDYTYGFSSDVGGGPYPRHFIVDGNWQNYCEILVAVGCENSNLSEVSAQSTVLVADSVAYALTLWNHYCAQVNDKPRALIRILDNGIYPVGSTTYSGKGETAISLPVGAELSIVAEDGVQPTLVGQNAQLTIGFPQPDRSLARALAATPLEQAASVVEEAPVVDRKLLLSGLRIVGRLVVEKVDRAKINALDLVIEHCSIIGGGIDVELEPENAPALALLMLRTIVGPLRMPPKVAELRIVESIVDSQLAPQASGQPNDYALVAAVSDDNASVMPGLSATIDRCTIFGKVNLQGVLQANAVLFTDAVVVKSPANETAKGIARYCYLPTGSAIPACDDCLYEGEKPTDCQTCLGNISRPVFSSQRYGRPGYAQLSNLSADEILYGVGKIAEIGVFHHLYQPQRETNIQLMLEEYLPLGLDAGVFRVT